MIKFGTDGWRGIISKEFTFENVRRVAASHAEVLREDGAKRVAVGYDMRFLSDVHASLVAEVFSSAGIDVAISDSPCPTPAVSCFTRFMEFDGGVVITASHNTGEYNGYKVKEPFGGAARTRLTNRIERNIGKGSGVSEPSGRVDRTDMNGFYVEKVRQQIELSLFSEREVCIVHDPMYGVQQNLLSQALRGTKVSVIQMRSYRDPLFGGIHPEPVVASNIKPLMYRVRGVNADIGIAHDGDGDRVGIVDEMGRFVNSQVVFALLLLHIVRNRGMKGKVAKTVSSGYLVDRICRAEGLELYETAVGFKNISEIATSKRLLFGGEESGGYALMDYLPERDGLLMGLLVVEKMLAEGKKLSVLVDDLFREFGTAYYIRIDLPVSQDEKGKLSELVKSPPDRLGGMKVRKVLTIDGLKLIFDDDSWILFRPSGTEPLFRVYAEASSEETARSLIDAGKSMLVCS